jgi:hypothetical protein
MKLATIERILELNPIPGKDAIEMATVLGWEVVVKKGEFSVGDYCVYIPIDTECDTSREHFSFLNKKRIVTAKFNTECGPVYSQGLCLPLNVFMYIPEFASLVNNFLNNNPSDVKKDAPECHETILTTSESGRRMIEDANHTLLEKFSHLGAKVVYRDGDSTMVTFDLKGDEVLTREMGEAMRTSEATEKKEIEEPTLEDTDVADIIGVTKYEYKQPSTRRHNTGPKAKKESVFPGFPIHIIPKTDEDNLKTKYKALEELKDVEYYISLKMDGSSMTLIWDDDMFSCSSRNISLYKGKTTLDGETPISESDLEYDFGGDMVSYVKKEKLETKLRGKRYAVQGEFVGWKINGNKLNYPEDSYDYFVFTVKDLETGKYLSLVELTLFCDFYGFETVPILTVESSSNLTVKYFQEYANKVTYDFNGKVVDAEGIVVRPTQPFCSKVLGKSFSVKIINQKYKAA